MPYVIEYLFYSFDLRTITFYEFCVVNEYIASQIFLKLMIHSLSGREIDGEDAVIKYTMCDFDVAYQADHAIIM